MSPLEAAKRLADPKIGTHCDFCSGSPIGGHFDDCPTRAVPKIVAALVAADVLLACSPLSEEPGPGFRLVCVPCRDALAAAMKGAAAP